MRTRTGGTRRRTRPRAVALGIAGASAALVLGTSLWAYADTRRVTAPADHADTANGGTEGGTEGEQVPTVGDAAADPALAGTGVEVPRGWELVREHGAGHDTEEVTVRRYQEGGEYDVAGPHLSVVVGSDGRLIGVTALDPREANDPDALPGAEQAREAAYSWLARQDSEYLAGLEEQWVDRHDEVVVGADGEEHVIPGVKVKTRHADGRYAWVIVGADSRVVTFERDVTWDAVRQRRATQMWLHNAWIAAVEGTGGQPPAPAALAAE
ncbi:hypothetical protein [Nocardiopsis sp. CC223A]|uniref:hypothetical protein n=1 Tax=Nocardiopsis sp. CC223A TaxID=3044051 RepID=UPI00278BED7F|nr:hypothetical protein [Nocardiopsis sp. CC223A]